MGNVLVKSCTRSRSSRRSSSDGGAKPVGCFVEMERKHGVSAGMRFSRTARVDVRRREGRVREAIVIWQNVKFKVVRGDCLWGGGPFKYVCGCGSPRRAIKDSLHSMYCTSFPPWNIQVLTFWDFRPILWFIYKLIDCLLYTFSASSIV
jgi:hypothetical protein